MQLENGEVVNLEMREPEAEYRGVAGAVGPDPQWQGSVGTSGGNADRPGDGKDRAERLPSRKQSEGTAGSRDSRLKLPTAESSGRVTGQQ